MRIIALMLLLVTALGSLAPASETDVGPEPDPIGDLIRERINGTAPEPSVLTFATTNEVAKSNVPRDRPDMEWVWRTVYGEARGQSALEIKAIARIIFNRWASGRWGTTLKGVVLAPAQFSVWNAGDPNRPIVESPTIARRPGWRRVRRLVEAAWADHRAGAQDPTCGALNYHHGGPPSWAIGQTPRKIGEAFTYRLTKKELSAGNIALHDRPNQRKVGTSKMLNNGTEPRT